MLMTKSRSSPATPGRPRSPHSMMIAPSKSSVTRSASSISGTPGKACMGSGAGSLLMTRTSLPSARRAYAMASCDPIESPSGRECEEMRKRRRARMASTTCRNSLLLVGLGDVGIVGGMDVLQELLDAILSGDRIVVGEPELWYAPQAKPSAKLAAQKWRRAFEGASRGGPGALVAEHRVHDSRHLQIRAEMHPRQGHESD